MGNLWVKHFLHRLLTFIPDDNAVIDNASGFRSLERVGRFPIFGCPKQDIGAEFL